MNLELCDCVETKRAIKKISKSKGTAFDFFLIQIKAWKHSPSIIDGKIRLHIRSAKAVSE